MINILTPSKYISISRPLIHHRKTLHRLLSTTPHPKMPQSAQADVPSDPTIENQWDNTTPKKEQFADLYAITDALKVSLLGTQRSGIGPVFRSMAVAKRNGPDFYYLANNNSQKFKDLASDSTATITFQNSSTQDWVSVSGDVTTTSNDDPRIKEYYSKGTNAWFGDLGDGVHTGGPEDPRMALIEVKAKYIVYWKATASKVGFVKEVVQAATTGKTADTGFQRQLSEEDIKAAREYGSE